MRFGRVEPQKSSLSTRTETTEKAAWTNSAISDKASAIRLSADLGFAQTRRNQGKFEKSISVVEVGEIESAEKTSIKKTPPTDYWNNAESRESESGVDV